MYGGNREKTRCKRVFYVENFCNMFGKTYFCVEFGVVVMTDEEKKLLSTFEARLRHLIYLHDELKREYADLQRQAGEKEDECRRIQADYDELQKRYTDLKTATAISIDGSDVRETRLRLSRLVREVDKCISLLNSK